MNLELIKNNKPLADKIHTAPDSDEVKFNFFKNMIKKDLEVALWCNKLCESFNDVKIYSDFRSELNSFEYIVSFLTGVRIDFLEDTLEYEISGRCTENFLSLMISDVGRSNKLDADKLAHKFTQYILESIEFQKYSMPEARKFLQGLDRKYFGGNDPTVYKYINPKYLN